MHNPRDIRPCCPIAWRCRFIGIVSRISRHSFKKMASGSSPSPGIRSMCSISALRFLPHEPLTARWLEGNAESVRSVQARARLRALFGIRDELGSRESALDQLSLMAARANRDKTALRRSCAGTGKRLLLGCRGLGRPCSKCASCSRSEPAQGSTGHTEPSCLARASRAMAGTYSSARRPAHLF